MTPLLVAIAGVGGQGVLVAARLLGEAAFRRGLPVAVSQLHGMSQRGGAVEATVCLGEELLSTGGRPVDALIGLELLEALRLADRLAPGAIAVVQRRLQPPPGAARSRAPIPTEEEVLAALRARARVHVIGGDACLPGNIVALGALSALGELPVDADDVLAAIRRLGGDATREANVRAFSLGRMAVQATAHR